MLDMNIHPGPFDLVGILSNNPMKEYGSPRCCLGSFVGIIKVVVHSPAQVSGQADIEHFL